MCQAYDHNDMIVNKQQNKIYNSSTHGCFGPLFSHSVNVILMLFYYLVGVGYIDQIFYEIILCCDINIQYIIV